MGKQVLVFGGAWYRAFPGAVQWREGCSFEHVLAAHVDHTALQKAVGALVARCHTGVVDRDYTEIVEDYSDPQNTATVAAQMLGLLRGEIELTFPKPVTTDTFTDKLGAMA